MKEGEMGKACSTIGMEEKYVRDIGCEKLKKEIGWKF
jgi:hypothetical protein